MKFILYSLNYAPELTGIGKYNGELAPELVKRGVETYVLTAPPYYPEWQRHEGYRNNWNYSLKDGVHLYRCPLYVPAKVTTLKRLVHLASFAISSGLKLFTLLKKKPDVVFLVQPTLFCAPLTLLFCKISGAKAVMHIQDFEVDAVLGLGMAGNGKLATCARRVESWLLKRFDWVTSISYSMLENAKAKGVDESKLALFPNWSDTHFVTPEISGERIRQEWKLAETDKVVLYSGNIGAKQGLEIILDAAEAYRSKLSVQFVVIGSGAYREKLESIAQQKGLTNIRFLPLQPWEDVPAILAMADLHLVIQKRGAADAVLPSKLTNILSAGGHALITADPDTELGKIAQKFPGIYHLVEPESSQALIEALDKTLELDTQTPNLVARNYAVEHLNDQAIFDRFVAQIKQQVK